MTEPTEAAKRKHAKLAQRMLIAQQLGLHKHAKRIQRQLARLGVIGVRVRER